MASTAEERASVAKSTFWAESVLLPVFVGWFIAALPALSKLFIFGGELSFAADNDALMRVVQVRDLLAGQGWFDLAQHRLGIGDNTPLHWSRLVDAPLAGLILLFEPIYGRQSAELVTVTVWPLALLVPGLWAAASIGRRLGGRFAGWAAAIFMAAMLQHTNAFAPGNVDHHNLQLVLLLVVLACLCDRRPRLAALGGVCTALAISVGIETVPHFAALGIFVALRWATEGAATRAQTLAFTGGLIVALPLLFLASAPASAYSGGFCDALSVDLALPVFLAPAGLFLLARFASAHPAPLRMAAVLAAGALSLGATALAAPACLGNPVSEIDPFLRLYWYDRVAEVSNAYESLWEFPVYAIPIYAAGIAGGFAAIFLLLRGKDRAAWGAITTVFAVAALISAWQIRGAVMLGPLAVLPLSVTVARLFVRSRETGRRRTGFAAIGLALFALPILWIYPIAVGKASLIYSGRIPPSSLGLRPCMAKDVFAPLATLPPGLVSASSNLGPHILIYTPQSVIAAPYHRSEAGMIAQFRIALAADASEAETRLRALGADYLVVCASDPEYEGQEELERGFVYRLAQGEAAPPFLDRVGPTEGALAIYRLLPPPGTEP
jgi:hypothetical protein